MALTKFHIAFLTNLEPLSMQTPTVQNWPNLGSLATLRPFDKVVIWVSWTFLDLGWM